MSAPERFAEDPAANSADSPASAAAEEAQPDVDPAELSEEEQLAAYEEALKDEDWGHQPC